MENKPNGGLMANHRATAADRREFLVNNELMSDVVFVVGKFKQKIYAHKQLLVAASDYFYVMLEGNFSESKAAEIPLEDIEWPILKEILRHIYCGKVDLNSENIREMFIHSKKFLLTELLEEVSEFLVESVTSESALVSLSENRFYEFQEVDDKCLMLIGDNPLQYFSAEDFARIDQDSLELIVNISRINCSNLQLLDALQDWQKANPAENVDGLTAYMERTVRLYRCQRWHLYGKVSDHHYNLNDQPTVFKIFVHSVSSVYLYGLGVIAKKGKIRIQIKRSADDVLCDKSYDVDEREGMAIMDCFIPKCELKPQTSYTISMSGGSGDSAIISKRIIAPIFLNNRNLDQNVLHLSISAENCRETATNIAFFYCNAG